MRFWQWPVWGFLIIGCYAAFMSLVLTRAGSESPSFQAVWTCGRVAPNSYVCSKAP